MRSVRLGAESVALMCLEERDGMLADRWEIQDALAECVLVKNVGNWGEVVADVVIYPQVLINVNVSDVTKKTYASNDKVIEVVEEINEILKDKGRTLIRPSGTEPLVRVMVEGEDITEIKGYAEQIAKVIKSI